VIQPFSLLAESETTLLQRSFRDCDSLIESFYLKGFLNKKVVMVYVDCSS
jgi:hypothetical protein